MGYVVCVCACVCERENTHVSLCEPKAVKGAMISHRCAIGILHQGFPASELEGALFISVRFNMTLLLKVFPLQILRS